VDTLGLLLTVVVHSASLQDSQGAKLVFARLQALQDRFPRLQLIWADGAYGVYGNQLAEWVAALAGWVLEVVKRPQEAKGFVLLPRRWVVERTFAWLTQCRRLSKDYETLPKSSEALIYIAMIRVMVRRLAPA
jgi:putative transposase